MACNSSPPPCLSWAVRSSSLSAERFLVRPLGTGSGGGGPLGVPSLGFHSWDWQRLMAQRRLPFRRTSFLPRQKGGKERPGASPWTPKNGQRTPAWGLQFQPAALFVLGCAVPVRLC